MNQNFDAFLEDLFTSVAPQVLWINILLGVALLIVGITLIRKSSKKRNKTSRLIGLICVGIGSLGIVINILKTFY
jgi:vacuolar-type H+-ATPase subunit I/STV1